MGLNQIPGIWLLIPAPTATSCVALGPSLTPSLPAKQAQTFSTASGDYKLISLHQCLDIVGAQ